jgi:hypothetical protein
MEVTELSSATFVFIKKFAEAEIDIEILKINTETDIDGNRHGLNTAWTRTKSKLLPEPGIHLNYIEKSKQLK